MTATRLAWRHHRFEMTVLIGLCLVVAAIGVAVAWQLNAARGELMACYQTAPDSAVLNWPCRHVDEWANRLSGIGSILLGCVTVAPFVVGLFLGAPLVAKEIERRTAPMAWTLSPSRRRWLAGRAIPVLLIASGALLVLGQASEILALAMSPDGLGFPNLGTHGPLVAARGVAVLVMGIVVGLVVGRQLPAILLTGLLTAGLMAGVEIGRSALIRHEAEWVAQGSQNSQDSMIFDSGFRSETTGEVITWETAYERYPDSFMTEDEYIAGEPVPEEQPPGMSPVWRVVRAQQYPWFVAREAAVLAGVAVLGALAAGYLVGRRRPE